MLGMSWLPASTRLGHERQDFWIPCDGMHVCTRQTSVYTLIRKSFVVRNRVNTNGQIPSTGNCLSRGGSNPRRCIKQDSEPDALPTELFRPQWMTSFQVTGRLDQEKDPRQIAGIEPEADFSGRNAVFCCLPCAIVQESASCM